MNFPGTKKLCQIRLRQHELVVSWFESMADIGNEGKRLAKKFRNYGKAYCTAHSLRHFDEELGKHVKVQRVVIENGVTSLVDFKET